MKPEFEYQCDIEWDEMSGGDRRRSCEECREHVYHISHMTTEEARKFFREHDYDVCVDFFCDADGEAVFAEPEKRLSLQVDGIKQLIASAAAVIPLAIGAAFIDFDRGPAPENAVVAGLESHDEPIDLRGPNPIVTSPAPPVPLAPVDSQPEPVAEHIEPAEAVIDEPEPEPPPVKPPQRLRGRVAPGWLD